MRGQRGRRLVLMLPVVLLLTALSPSVQAAPLDTHWSSQTAATIGTNSCQGVDACLNLSGNVGNNSCNGANACRGVTGNVGDNSCSGLDSSCRDRSANVGNNSCNETSACRAAPGASIGDGSCNGFEACRDLQVTVGSNSCNGGNGVCRDATSPIGDCANNAVTPPECAQPDARIRRSGGELWGNDVYNSSLTDQYVSMKIYAGDVRRVYISIQNDTDTAASFKVCQCSGYSPGGYVGVTDRFFIGRSGHEITAAVNAGTFTTPTLAPGATFTIRARIDVTSAAPVGQLYAWGITASNVSNTKADTVAIWVQRKVNLAPDMTLSPGDPSGDHEYTFDFGNLASETSQTFTLKNVGTGASKVLAVTIPGGFSLSNDNCTGGALAVAATCSFQLTATPFTGCEGLTFFQTATVAGGSDTYLLLHVFATCPA